MQTLALPSKEEKALSKQASKHFFFGIPPEDLGLFRDAFCFSCVDLEWVEKGALEFDVESIHPRHFPPVIRSGVAVAVRSAGCRSRFPPHQKHFPADPKALQGRLGYVILPMSLEPNSLWPRWTWPRHLSGETLNQIPEPPRPAPLDAKEQFPRQETLWRKLSFASRVKDRVFPVTSHLS